MALPAFTEAFVRDFAAAGRLNLTIPISEEYSYACGLLRTKQPIVFVIFPEGFSTFSIRCITTGLFKKQNIQSLVIEARNNKAYFPALLIPIKKKRKFGSIENALHLQRTHEVIFFDPEQISYPDSVSKLADYWQLSLERKFDIIESTYCNGISLDQKLWNDWGLLRDLPPGAHRRVGTSKHSYLTRGFNDIRLNVVEFSGPRNVYSNSGEFQYVQKIALEYVFLQPSGTYKSSSHDFGTRDLEKVAHELVANYNFIIAVHKVLQPGNSSKDN